MDLIELEKEVTDEVSFLRFVHALIEDREQSIKNEKANPSSPYGPEAGGWENTSVESFLSGASAWAKDSNFGRNMAFAELELKEVSEWRRMAAFLMAGKVYE